MNKKSLLSLLAGITIIGSVCGLAGAEDTTPAGTYTAFALGNDGYVISMELAASDASLIMVLNEDGTCIADFGEGNTNEMTWEIEDSVITFDADGDSAKGTYEDGILEFSPMPGTSILLAKDGVDFSAYDMIRTEEDLAKMREEFAAKQEARKDEIIKKYDLKNDDTHTLYKEGNVIFCSEVDSDGNVVSFTCYNYSLTEDSIPEFKELYESSGSVESVEQDGDCLIISFPTDVYNKEMIEQLYGNKVFEIE